MINKLYHALTVAFLIMISVNEPLLAATRPEFPVYNGKDLGVRYSPSSTQFIVWSPVATAVRVRLYAAGENGSPISETELTKGESGTWVTTIKGDLKNQYYTFQTYINDKWQLECPDIYAKAVGVNGKRGMVVDLESTNPDGWATDKKPVQKSFTDIILYELHIRDISVSPNSGIKNKGKFLGLTEWNTHNSEGESTGLDHLKELGITHVHLMPSFDFNSVDEKSSAGKYNWGYDPLNYNVPEGSYSTNPYDGNVRIREFKQLVKTFHENGLRVIMDVVYNHTSNIDESNFTQFAPGYFYRHNADGTYSNGTGCGNETASEKAMMRKFMVESVCYWATEYHVDGFRFDLMGVHDIVTMNAISSALHKIDPTIYIYGEGWDAGATPLPATERALKRNMMQLDQVAAFSDDIRDAIRGANTSTKGFVSGGPGTAESIRFGIVASTLHPQVKYSQVNYSKAPWAAEPYQAITYASCHDDNSLFDRLKAANPLATEAELIKMDKLAAAIVFTSQGVPFIQAGEEIIRTKQGVANSYKSPDSINEIDWAHKTKYKSVFTYYKGLIELRKNHPAFRMPGADMIRKHLVFLPATDSLVVAYQLTGHANGDKWKNILVVLNGNASSITFKLPAGNWTLSASDEKIDEKGIRVVKGEMEIPGTAAIVLFEK